MIIKVDPDQIAVTDEKVVLQYLITKYTLNRPRHQKLQEYYEGKHDILDRKMFDASKPNNKVVNNYAAYITDTQVGYFMGSPVTYMADGKENEVYLENLLV
jgi:SPP1 family phage portal protein